jgi:nucleoside-diphosphate-sugar epimerase
MKSQRLLVTGANGFLGSEIIRQAVRQGISVQGTDLHPLPRGEGYPYHQGDILRSDSLTQAMDGVGIVIHTAGLAHIFNKSQALIAPYREVNAKGTTNVAEKAAKMGVTHFILVSSVAVYGRSVPPADESVPCQPTGAYAESKWEAEILARKIAETGRMQLTILRLATLFGEEDPGNVARLMRAIDRGRFIWVGNGTNRKSLLYRGDAARACLETIKVDHSDRLQIYNVSAQPYSMRDIVDGLAQALGKNPPKWRIPESLARSYAVLVNRIPLNIGSISTTAITVKKWLAEDAYSARLFEQSFQFKTQVDLAEGLSREVAWYRNINKA